MENYRFEFISSEWKITLIFKEEKLFLDKEYILDIFLGTKIAFINIEGGLSVFDTESETREELLDNSSFVSAIVSQWWRYFSCYLCFMFQKTLNTTKYSLSPRLSFLLLSYDQSGHQSKYKLINLKKRLEIYH